MIDGVKTIKNERTGKWGNTPRVKLVRIQDIGELNSDDDNYLLFLPTDMTKDREGNIYILEEGNKRIQKFDPNGKYLLSMGERGQGPGEFRLPRTLITDNNNHIIAGDALGKKLEIFAPGGERVRTLTLSMTPYVFRVNRDNHFVARTVRSMFKLDANNASSDVPILRTFSVDGELVHEIGLHDKNGKRSENQIVFDLDNEDNIVLSFVYQNRIEKYTKGGELLFRSERPINYKIGKREPIRRRNDGRMIMAAAGGRMNIVTADIAADNNGRIWVATYNRQLKEEEEANTHSNFTTGTIKVNGNTDLTKIDAYDLEIFSGEGELLGRLRLDHFIDRMKIFDDMLYIIDKKRTMRLYEYQIVEN